MKGVIIVNGYFSNDAVNGQTSRLLEEFEKLGVEISVVKSNEIITAVANGEPCFYGEKLDADFIVYLNKDRYQAELLEKKGYKLFNSSNSIIVCDDKMLTFTTLSNNGILMPKTISSPIMYSNNEDEKFLRSVENELGYPIIVKSVYGSMGKGVFKADNFEELKSLFEELKLTPHLYQQAVGRLGTDTRVIVVGGKVVGAIRRSSSVDFRSNVELGGSAVAVDLTDNQRLLAEKTATILGLDYAGIDILSDNENDYLCEVNSNAFFNGFEKATGINVASIYAKYIVDGLKK